MSFVASFSTTQNLGEPSQIVFTDDSTGSDSNITSRRIYLRKADGTFLVPTGTTTDYIVWDYDLPSITVDVLDKDYALLVTVGWVNVGGSTLYDDTQLNGYTLFNRTFSISLSQWLSGNNLLINDNNFFENKSQLTETIDSGNELIELAADIHGAQNCFDLGTTIRLNSQYYFNSNS